MAALTSLTTLRGHRPRALVTVHGVPEEDYAATARLLRLAGLPVVACGPGVAAGLEEHGLKVAATIVNGVAPASANAGATPAFPGRYALVVGRLVPQKNVALALDALARLDDVPLVIAGEGPLRAELEAQATRLGIAQRVMFAGARSDARQLMREAAAVLVPSRWEGLPLVVLEALAAGTPVVATAVRGMRELLTPETAALVPPDDPDALAQALRRILTDDGYASALETAGRALAARYSEQAMVADYVSLYARLVAGRVG
jgi:glycosyltransferase involved in cell wall biosynthesis